MHFPRVERSSLFPLSAERSSGSVDGITWEGLLGDGKPPHHCSRRWIDGSNETALYPAGPPRGVKITVEVKGAALNRGGTIVDRLIKIHLHCAGPLIEVPLVIKTAHGRIHAAVVEDVPDGVTRIGGRAFKTQAIAGWNFSGYPGPQVHVLALAGVFGVAEEKSPFQVLILRDRDRGSVRLVRGGGMLREGGRLPFGLRNRSALTMATS